MQVLQKANTSVTNIGFSLVKLKTLSARDVPREWRRQSGRRSRGARQRSAPRTREEAVALQTRHRA
eukprot:219499-Rhodomonas_salina.1